MESMQNGNTGQELLFEDDKERTRHWLQNAKPSIQLI